MKYTQEQIKEIAEAMDIEKKAFTYKRLQILLWRMQGKKAVEIANLSGKSLMTITRICSLYDAGGVANLSDKRKSGNNQKLPRENEANALAKLKEEAEQGHFLRTAEAKAAFERETGITYHNATFYRLLERHEWRKVVPRGQHPSKASEEAMEASKKLT